MKYYILLYPLFLFLPTLVVGQVIKNPNPESFLPESRSIHSYDLVRFLIRQNLIPVARLLEPEEWVTFSKGNRVFGYYTDYYVYENHIPQAPGIDIIDFFLTKNRLYLHISIDTIEFYRLGAGISKDSFLNYPKIHRLGYFSFEVNFMKVKVDKKVKNIKMLDNGKEPLSSFESLKQRQKKNIQISYEDFVSYIKKQSPNAAKHLEKVFLFFITPKRKNFINKSGLPKKTGHKLVLYFDDEFNTTQRYIFSYEYKEKHMKLIE